MYVQILAIGALVALVWAGIVLARGSVVGTALAVLVAGSCFGYAYFHANVAHVPLTADRLLLLVLVAQYAVYRHWGRIDQAPLLKSDYVLGSFLAVLAVSTLVHDYWALNYQPLATLTLCFLMPGVLYWTVCRGEWTARTAWGVCGTLAAFGVYLCVTTLAETQGAWAYVFPKYIASPAFADFRDVGRGPFLNPFATGLVQTLGMCAALAFWPRVSWLGKFLLGVVLGVFAVGIYSTLTPSVWLGAGAALATILVGSAAGAWRFRVVTATVAAAAIVAGVSWQQLSTPKRDKEPSGKTVAESAEPRPNQAVVAWRMFLERPILGCGLGQYSREVPFHLGDRSTVLTPEKTREYAQHNVFLSLLVETGLLGTSLFVALLGCWTYTAWRLRRAAEAPLWARQMALMFLAFLAAYLVVAMFCDLSAIPMVNMFLFFLGGAITGLTPWLVDEPETMSVETYQRWEEPQLVAG